MQEQVDHELKEENHILTKEENQTLTEASSEFTGLSASNEEGEEDLLLRKD